MINQIPNAKLIILNRKNNLILVYKKIDRRGYIYLFTSLKIIFSKKFKTNILDHPDFFDRVCLLIIDEIHLINQ